MTDATTIAARRYSELHPGYHLVTAQPAAVPFSWLTLEVLAQQRKPLPVVDEFVLRFCQQGVDTIGGVAGVLGIGDEAVRTAVARRLSDEHLDYRPDTRPEHHGTRRITLTRTGTVAAHDLQTTSPQRVTHLQAFDRLLWTPTATRKSELIGRNEATTNGMVILPAARTRDVTTDEVTPRAINRILGLSDHQTTGSGADRPDGSDLVEVLAVDAVTRQYLHYLPAVILVFAAAGFDDVRLTVVVDDLVSKAHDQALAEAGGTGALKISLDPSVGEPALPPQLAAQRAPHDTVRGLQRRADTTPPGAEPGTVLAAADEDAATARAELAALTVRSVPSFEHPELLVAAVASARRRFLLLAPLLRAAVVTDGLIAQLEVMLRRRDLVARIAYGLGHPDRDHDADALDRIQRLADAHDNLTLVRVDTAMAHDLIFDDTWVNTSFDWLSYRGPNRVYRREEGTLVRSADAVDDRYQQCVSAIDLTIVT
ncbi:hypothetical protein [Amycolatopsis sp. TNS106]|uniref:hypothetical protein n=1 Tax=Amycolatopsis sp. TNS106 TaxID=2861750 RepID=UPI001C59DA08|nr:hypothetical protein [Amycolatopsis sp. TNS106]QXV57440.1 hypothetical protein CVV72_10855 [Amycolatopsis sp. TNS106]